MIDQASAGGIAILDGEASLPPRPRSIAETGLDQGFLVELACKILYYAGEIQLSALSDRIALPMSVTGDILEFLKRERLAEVKRGGDVRASYVYALTDLGRQRAQEFLQVCGYAGPAPVTLAQYDAVTLRQTVRGMSVTRTDLNRAFDGVVMAEGMIDRLGPAVNSGRSIFLYGPAGNGKTFIAERLGRILKGDVLIPHAVAVDNQVIRVFDPVLHVETRAPQDPDPVKAVLAGLPEHDRRWAVCARPVVVAGGELTLSMLDLSFDPHARYYEAPLQVKANGGIFLIDDLGRQMVRPFDLLNRWIIPLEKGRDYLSLHNGKKFGVPFDQLILFSTNIEPRELADGAFLRRIGYKIHIDYLDESHYTAICRQVCERLCLPYRPEAIRYLLDEEHARRGIRLSACHPNDILSRVVEICRYEGIDPVLDAGLVRRACKDYFTET